MIKNLIFYHVALVSIKFKTSTHLAFAINACSFKHSDPTSNEQISLKPQDLVVFKDAAGKPSLIHEALRQFVLFGARYAFPAVQGEVTRGLPTLYAAPPIKDKIIQPNGLPPVWPDKNGTVRGMALYPLYPNAPYAAQRKVHCMSCWCCLMHCVQSAHVRKI